MTANCCTLVRVAEAEQHFGAIAGTEEGTFTGNFFVSDDLAGLGRVSYAGRAEPISFEALAGLEDVPEALTTFTLIFRAEEEILKDVPFSYGDSFGGEVYPPLPQKEGHYAAWSLDTLEDLRFDTVVEAVYTPCITTLAAPRQREDGRAVFYLEGEFKAGDALEAQALEPDPAVSEEMAAPALRRLALLELWRLSVPEDGQEVHTLRCLPPEESGELLLYVRTQAGWTRVETEEIGRYLAFQAEGNEVELAVCSVGLSPWVWCLAAGLLALLLLGVRFMMRRSRKKHGGTASNRPDAASPAEMGS